MEEKEEIRAMEGEVEKGMEEPQRAKEEKPKLIIYTSKENEACKPVLEEAKRVADESGIELHELDVADLDFPKEALGEHGGTPTTCVVSKGRMECFVGGGPDYREKLLEIMRKLGEKSE